MNWAQFYEDKPVIHENRTPIAGPVASSWRLGFIYKPHQYYQIDAFLYDAI